MPHFDWLVDGSIVGVYLLLTMIAGLAVRKYVGKVEDFLVAGREMNVYLGIASLAATEFGIITCMYTAQNGYKYGFAGVTPGILQALAMFVIGITGFCVKPLRDSGVMTMPELFEKRFGPRIRWAAGVVIVLGGLLNMGVFLRIGGEFLVVTTGLDPKRLELTMTLLLVAVGVYTVLGGMLSVLITDFLQFVVMSIGLIVVTVLILYQVGWAHITATVEQKYGAGGFNPFLNGELGWSFVIFQLFLQTAATLTWQTTIARVLAAKDTDTGRKIYTRTSFFFVCRSLIPCLWGIAALATLAPAAYLVLTPGMQQQPSLYGMPLFLSTFVPIGLMGLLVAAMLAADMSTDSSYMLTWSSVIYNDMLAPFRKQPWSETQGTDLESRDRRGDRRVPALLRTVVRAQGRSVDLLRRDGHDLPCGSLRPAHLGLLLEARELLGRRRRDRGRRAVPRRLPRDGAGRGHEGARQGDRPLLERSAGLRAGGSRHGRRLAAQADGEEGGLRWLIRCGGCSRWPRSSGTRPSRSTSRSAG